MNKLGLWIAFVLGCFLIFEYSNINGIHSYGTAPTASQPGIERAPAYRSPPTQAHSSAHPDNHRHLQEPR